MLTITNRISFAVMILSIIIFASALFSQPSVNEHSIKFSDVTTATLVGEDGVILKTTNNGTTWDEQTSGVTNVLYGNSHISGLSLVVGENGVVLRSTDGGINWDYIALNTYEHLRDVEIVNGTTAAACGDNGTMLLTTDGGLSWSETASGVTTNLNDIKFVSGGIGYATGDNAVLIKTTNSGSSWAEIDMSFTNGKINAVEAIDENNLILVGEMGKVLLSNDGGSSWYAPMGLSYETDFNDVVFFDAYNGVIAGNNGLILNSIDGGYSWNESSVITSGDSYDYFSVAFADENNGISTGRGGIEIFTTDGGLTWTEAPPAFTQSANSPNNGRVKNIELKQNYPNPFNPSTKISYVLPSDAKVSLRIYDIIGKEVASLVSGNQTAGLHTVDFNASNLSSGVYFYTLNVVTASENSSKVMKMILTK